MSPVEVVVGVLVSTMFLALAYGWWCQAVLLQHIKLSDPKLFEALGMPQVWLPGIIRRNHAALTDLIWSDSRFRLPDEQANVLRVRVRWAVILCLVCFLAALAVSLFARS
jgi:hypothetical protein